MLELSTTSLFVVQWRDELTTFLRIHGLQLGRTGMLLQRGVGLLTFGLVGVEHATMTLRRTLHEQVWTWK